METMQQIKDRLIKERQSNAEYLRECLTRTSKRIGLENTNVWYRSSDTLLSVAEILEGEILFTAADAIRFFEKPWHFENDMAELASEFEGKEDE